MIVRGSSDPERYGGSATHGIIGGRAASFSEAQKEWLVRVMRRFPPRHTIFKPSEGRAADEYQDEKRFPLFRYVGAGPELFSGRDVLDLGCGYGGRPVAYLEHGARSVVGVEITQEMVSFAEAFSRSRRATGLRFAVGSGEDVPLAADAVDLITMNDVMEHVVSPRDVLSECWRVLRPGGRLLVVFPPYYDLTSGSHLDGYATSLPGLHVVFPTGTLRAAARAVLDERVGDRWHEVLRDEPTDKLWNLNGLTVRGFKRLVRESRFTPESVRHLGHIDHRLSDHQGIGLRARMPLFVAAELPAQIPLLQEVCCLRVCAVLRK